MFGNKLLVDGVNAHITAGSNTDIEMGYLAKSISNSDTVHSIVATEADLPTAADNTGRFYYVEDINAYRYSESSIFNGTLWAWGYNVWGQIGNGDTSNRSSPVSISGGGITWKKVTYGGAHGLSIKTDGTLWAWGRNAYGGVGDGTATSRRSPVTTAGGGTTWDNIGAGYYHSIATKTDGTLWTWGYNLFGQLGDNTTTSRRSPVTTIGGGTTWDKVAGGFSHSIATKTDGTLWAWGSNGAGRLGDNTTTSRSSPVTTAGGGTNWDICSAGTEHSAATKTDGTLWVWGSNSNGRLGDNTTTVRTSPVTTAGGGTNWSMVACQAKSTAGIKTDGTLWTWGYNLYGQLGDNTASNRSSPGTTVGGGTNWDMVGIGYDHMSAIKTDGTLWSWGRGEFGQMGNGVANSSNRSPVQESSGATIWHEVASGGLTTAALQQTYGKGF
jgi:alpha-tubulin suppressor-like RCC1 family protein